MEHFNIMVGENDGILQVITDEAFRLVHLLFCDGKGGQCHLVELRLILLHRLVTPLLHVSKDRGNRSVEL